jgi:hypothetical protein
MTAHVSINRHLYYKIFILDSSPNRMDRRNCFDYIIKMEVTHVQVSDSLGSVMISNSCAKESYYQSKSYEKKPECSTLCNQTLGKHSPTKERTLN